MTDKITLLSLAESWPIYHQFLICTAVQSNLINTCEFAIFSAMQSIVRVTVSKCKQLKRTADILKFPQITLSCLKAHAILRELQISLVVLILNCTLIMIAILMLVLAIWWDIKAENISKQ